MGGLSKAGIGLIVVVVVTLAAFLAQLCYVLWCRRRFHQQNLSGEILDVSGADHSSPSKELLYFFCWKNQSRIGPAASAPPFLTDGAPDALPESDDLVKWRDLYGPSRALFTIKEEEREDLTESDKSASETKKTKTSVYLEEHFEAALEREPPPSLVVVELEKETPFSTPCDSPYYTPSPSPSRENLTHSPETDSSVALEVGEFGFPGVSKDLSVSVVEV